MSLASGPLHLVLPAGLALAALALTACGSGQAESGQTAREVKEEADRVAGRVVTDLASTIGGDLTGFSGRFTECQVAGTWRYVGHGQFVGVLGSEDEITGQVRGALDGAGLAVEEGNGDLVGRGRHVVLSVSLPVALAGGPERMVTLDLGSDCHRFPDSEVAESTPEEDYTRFAG